MNTNENIMNDKSMKEPIFYSLLDTDKYKLSMMQANFHKFPSINVRYKFNCRTKGVDLTPLIPALRYQADLLGNLKFTESELQEQD